jgi:hypothetical protein
MYQVRNKKVMLDFDMADQYEAETRTGCKSAGLT